MTTKNDGSFLGFNPCHLRFPDENHDFVLVDAGISNSNLTFIYK
jgi:hypothetical protein